MQPVQKHSLADFARFVLVILYLLLLFIFFISTNYIYAQESKIVIPKLERNILIEKHLNKTCFFEHNVYTNGREFKVLFAIWIQNNEFPLEIIFWDLPKEEDHHSKSSFFCDISARSTDDYISMDALFDLILAKKTLTTVCNASELRAIARIRSHLYYEGVSLEDKDPYLKKNWFQLGNIICVKINSKSN